MLIVEWVVLHVEVWDLHMIVVLLEELENATSILIILLSLVVCFLWRCFVVVGSCRAADVVSRGNAFLVAPCKAQIPRSKQKSRLAENCAKRDILLGAWCVDRTIGVNQWETLWIIDCSDVEPVEEFRV